MLILYNNISFFLEYNINGDVLKRFLILLIITFLIGGIPSLIVGNSVDGLILPSLYPPKVLFPIVWGILYILMTISVFRVTSDDNSNYVIYFFQLIVNSLWTVIFFGLKLRLFAFMWLLFLLVLVIVMFIRFYKVDKLSGYLIIPYILWILFAGYINLAIYLLNR